MAEQVLVNGKIILASYDMCYSKVNEIDFEPGESNDSIFDKKALELNNGIFNDSVIENVKLTSCGDISIFFSNNLIFETFINQSESDEFWRFISNEKEKSEHIVFAGILEK